MDPDNCRYDSNPVTGPSPFLYADVVAVDSENSEALDAMRTCERYAVVAFWSLSDYSDCQKCYRFFFVPNPSMRMIRKSEKSELYQILYSSAHNKDVFFYFKGYHKNSPHSQTMQCCILNLGLGRDVSSRDIKDHCQSIDLIDESSLLG